MFEKRGPKLPRSNGGSGIPDGRRKNRAFETIERLRGRLAQRLKRGLCPPTTRDGKPAPSARLGSLDAVDSGPGLFVYSETRAKRQAAYSKLIYMPLAHQPHRSPVS
jgi:hypothetical protein